MVYPAALLFLNFAIMDNSMMNNLLHTLSILNASFFTKINSRSGISKSKVMIYIKF